MKCIPHDRTMVNMMISECLINLRGRCRKCIRKSVFALLSHFPLCDMIIIIIVCCKNPACQTEGWDWLSILFQISELWDTVIPVFFLLLIGICVFVLSPFMSYFLFDASLPPYPLHVLWLTAGFDEVQGASLHFGICVPVAIDFFFSFAEVSSYSHKTR